MKKIFTILFIINCSLIINCANAQAPQAIPYQAVARDSAGNIIANQNISLRFSIHPMPTGTLLHYQETHSATTNSLGLFTVNIGQGTPTGGTFSTITWNSGNKYLETQMDASGGSNYTMMGRTQMMSVPFALNAANGNWAKNGTDIYNSNTNNVGIGTTSPTTKLEVVGSAKVSGIITAESAIQARGGINNDGSSTGGDVNINENLRIGGSVSCIQGTCPPNGAIRLTPNLHLMLVQDIQPSLIGITEQQALIRL